MGATQRVGIQLPRARCIERPQNRTISRAKRSAAMPGWAARIVIYGVRMRKTIRPRARLGDAMGETNAHMYEETVPILLGPHWLDIGAPIVSGGLDVTNTRT